MSYDEKGHPTVQGQVGSPEDGLFTAESSPWGDTHDDIADMRRLGKKQEFKVGATISMTWQSKLTMSREISASTPR